MTSDQELIDALIEYEGFDVEEAVLTAKARSKLPSSAFCGPGRTYPAHDKKHVRNALTRLSQFGGKLKPVTRKRIKSCLKRKAKRMGIEIEETEMDANAWIDWLIKYHGLN